MSRSVERLSEVDLEAIAERYGVDAERARELADAAGQWLGGRWTADHQRESHASPREAPGDEFPRGGEWHTQTGPGPHPLDLPSNAHGLALSALDSARWTVRPGNNQLSGTGEGPPPPPEALDLVGELRARDWITNDGTLTLVGRHALARWCRGASEPAPPPEMHAPPA